VRALARIIGVTLLWCVAVFATGIGVGLVVTYWSHVVNVALIIIGLGGIAVLTLWSSH
jgi:hypothetical protein